MKYFVTVTRHQDEVYRTECESLAELAPVLDRHLTDGRVRSVVITKRQGFDRRKRRRAPTKRYEPGIGVIDMLTGDVHGRTPQEVRDQGI